MDLIGIQIEYWYEIVCLHMICLSKTICFRRNFGEQMILCLTYPATWLRSSNRGQGQSLKEIPSWQSWWARTYVHGYYESCHPNIVYLYHAGVINFIAYCIVAWLCVMWRCSLAQTESELQLASCKEKVRLQAREFVHVYPGMRTARELLLHACMQSIM